MWHYGYNSTFEFVNSMRVGKGFSRTPFLPVSYCMFSALGKNYSTYTVLPKKYNMYNVVIKPFIFSVLIYNYNSVTVLLKLTE